MPALGGYQPPIYPTWTPKTYQDPWATSWKQTHGDPRAEHKLSVPAAREFQKSEPHSLLHHLEAPGCHLAHSFALLLVGALGFEILDFLSKLAHRCHQLLHHLDHGIVGA